MAVRQIISMFGQKNNGKGDSMEINYSIETNIVDEIKSFGVETKLNDYIGVQKLVISKLEEEGYFGEVMNKETGMVMDITKKGIKETLGSGKRFQNLPRVLKELKLATIRKLPIIIQKAHLTTNDAKNTHENAAVYAYLEIRMNLNNVPIKISIDVKKTSAKNKFWIHYIDITKENSQLLSPCRNKVINEIENFSTDSIQQKQKK